MTFETYCQDICRASFGNKVQMMKILANYDAGLKAKEIRKFAEWCSLKGYDCYDWNMLIEQYEKENKDE